MCRYQITAVIAAISLTLGSLPAAAATRTFSVTAKADIDGVPSPAPYLYQGPIWDSLTELSSDVDSPLSTWSPYFNQPVETAAHVAADTSMGSVEALVYGFANHLSSTQFPSYGPGGWSESKFTDTVLVESALPAGTPVTLTFRNAHAVAWEGKKNYTANSRCVLGVGSTSVTSFWSTFTLNPSYTVPNPALVFDTTVGSRIALSGYLKVTGSGLFTIQGSSVLGGEISVASRCDLVLESATVPVTLQGDSQHVYSLPAL